MPPETLGEFEQLVLVVVLRLGDNAYGASVAREIESTTGRRVAIGAIYTTLDRLLGKGLVTARIGPPSGSRGGRRRKLYTLRPSGHRALVRAYRAWTTLTEGLREKLLS